MTAKNKPHYSFTRFDELFSDTATLLMEALEFQPLDDDGVSLVYHRLVLNEIYQSFMATGVAHDQHPQPASFEDFEPGTAAKISGNKKPA